jgi:peptidylprolyl isomerase
MANAGPDTNGSQFFLCFAPAPWLDDKHSVFGFVTDGFEVLQELEQLGSDSGEPAELVQFDVIVASKNDHPYEPQTL